MRGAVRPAPSLQRRNRGETIKKQLLHLNEYGLSGYAVRVSTSVFSKNEKISIFVANQHMLMFEIESQALAW
jgi:hypothetical protein